MTATNKLPNLHLDLDLVLQSAPVELINTTIYLLPSYNPPTVNMSENAPPQELPIFTSADRIRQLNDMDKVLGSYNYAVTIC